MKLFENQTSKIPHMMQYNAETDLVQIVLNRVTSAGVDLSKLHAGITTNLKGTDHPDRILQWVGDDRLTTQIQGDSLLVRWRIGLNTSINPGCLQFVLDFRDDNGAVVWHDRERYLVIDKTMTAESLVAQYPSLFVQYETAMRKLYADAQAAVEQATAEAGEAKTQADRANNEADRAEGAREDVTTAKNEVVTMREAVATDKAAAEAAQKDVTERQAKINTAHEDVTAKSSAAQQAAEQISADKAHIDRVVDNFDTISKAAINDIRNTTEEAKQLIVQTAVDETAKIQTMTSQWTSDTNAQIDRLNADIITVRQEFASSVSAAQGAAIEAAQHEQAAQGYRDEAQAAADSIGGAISPALLTTTAAGTGTVTMGSTADYPLQALAITGQTQQDGIPQPNNPVIPVSPGDGGVISVKVCGKNLVDKNGVKTNYYVNASGEEVRDPSWCVATIPVFGGASIAITATTQGAAPRYCFYDDAGLLLLATQSKVINIPQLAKYAKLSVRTTELDGFMAEYGSIQTIYEPYKDQTATISDRPLMRVGSVADSADFLSRQITRAVSEVSLDGASEWTGFSAFDTGYCIAVVEMPTLKGGNGITGALCNYFPEAGRAAVVNRPPVADGFALIPSGDRGRLYIALAQSNLSDVSLEGFKAWLSDHPIKIWAEAVAPTQEQIESTALHSYDGTTTISVYGTPGEPSPEIEVKAVLDATTVVADQQGQIDDLREMINNLQAAALAAEIGGTQ